MTTASISKTKPAKTFGDSTIKVTVWKNTSGKGPRYAAVPSRSYKKADEWNASDRFASDELLELSLLLQDAYRWMRATEAAERKADREAA
jgi:hypothetical protein